MFVVNRGRDFGFLRCSCGYAKVIRNPQEEQQLKRGSHRTPYDMPCRRTFWHPREDLAHEFRTDVLQLRFQRALPELQSEEPARAREGQDRFLRTLADSIRKAAMTLLSLEPRELAATSRLYSDRFPEIVLYDTVPGGAGYCRMLVERHSARSLLKAAEKVLDCKAGCTLSCRLCLRDYENQIAWEKLERVPVLGWLCQFVS